VGTSHYRDEIAIKNFGTKVRELRELRGQTIEQFANSEPSLGVTQLSRIELGQTNPTISTIFLIAQKLGISPADLIDFH